MLIGFLMTATTLSTIISRANTEKRASASLFRLDDGDVAGCLASDFPYRRETTCDLGEQPLLERASLCLDSAKAFHRCPLAASRLSSRCTIIMQLKRMPVAAFVAVAAIGIIHGGDIFVSSFSPPHQPPASRASSSGRAKSILTSSSSPTSSTRVSMGLFDFFSEKKLQRSAASPVRTASKRRPKGVIPDDFVAPEPRPLALADNTDIVKLLKSSLALGVRLATGVFVLGWKIDSVFYSAEDDGTKTYSLKLGPFSIRDTSSVLADAPRPNDNLILYEYDASPYCKRVRETMNLLDLTYEIRPCPGAREGKFSQEMFDRTGRRTVPFLVDPNTGKEMFESSDIIQYLLDAYGPPKNVYDIKALWPITFEAFSVFTSTLAAILCDMPGSRRQENARPDNEEMIPLELWGYECSPFCRPVFDKLCSLNLPHVVVSCSRGSINRDRLLNRKLSASGERPQQFQVPFLFDPNTGLELFESTAIIDYLERAYTTS